MFKLLVAAALFAIARPVTADPILNTPAVKLTSPGKGAARPLRYTVAKGSKQRMTTGMRMTIALAMGGSAGPVTKSPRIEMPADLEVVGVTSTGDIDYTFKFAAPRVIGDPATPKELVETLTRELADMKGIVGRAVVTNRGVVNQVKLDVPATAKPQLKQTVESLRQSMTQIVPPLPEQAVGAGAKWTVTMNAELNGIRVEQVADYELVELTATGGKLKVAITQTAKPQKITQQGMTVDLESFKSSGSGETIFVLSQIAPSAATVAVHNESKMNAGGSPFQLTMDMTMDLTNK